MRIKLKSIAVIVSGIVLAASFCGCNMSGSDNSYKNNDNGTEIVKPNPTKDITFSELVKDNGDKAKSFFVNLVKPQIVGEREVKAESWFIADKNSDDKVDLATIVYIYTVDDTTRMLEIAAATFTVPVSAQDIQDSKVTSVALDISRKEIFTFDAKDNYNNQDVTDALYSATKTISSLRLYSESEANNIDRIFDIVEYQTNKFQSQT